MARKSPRGAGKVVLLSSNPTHIGLKSRKKLLQQTKMLEKVRRDEDIQRVIFDTLHDRHNVINDININKHIKHKFHRT